MVLYEVSYKFEFLLLVPVALVVWFAVFPKLWKKSWEGRKTIFLYRDVKIFCILASCFMLAMAIFLGFSQVRMYQKTVKAYRAGEYKIVEGYVENYNPMKYNTHGYKSFEIDGVEFSYSPSSGQPGYNDKNSDGGVILGDGQHLKIGYVYYNRHYGNVIVYIEQLS